MMCVDLTKMMVLEELEKMRQDLGFYTQQAVRTAENERQCWRFSSDEQAQVRRTLLLPSGDADDAGDHTWMLPDEDYEARSSFSHIGKVPS